MGNRAPWLGVPSSPLLSRRRAVKRACPDDPVQDVWVALQEPPLLLPRTVYEPDMLLPETVPVYVTVPTAPKLMA